MTARRFTLVLVLLLAASAGVLLAYGASWATVAVPVFAGGVDAGPGRDVVLTGRDLAPLGAAMGWVGLAAVAALLATRTWGRRVTGAIVVVAGGSAGVIAVTFGLTEVASGGSGAFIEAALGTGNQPTDVATSGWWAAAAIAGLVMVACGMAAVIAGPSWPKLGARYSRGTPSGAPSAAATWDALDRGEDPTVDEPGGRHERDPG